MSGVAEVNIALAGIAGYGDIYLQALLAKHEAARAPIVGVVDTAPHRCRRLVELRELGIPVFTSLRDLFARASVEVLMVATPIHLHAPQTCFALEHGANVLCEKPVAGTLRDATRMIDAERRSAGRFVSIGYQWSFSRSVQALKRDIIAGLLGRPIRMKCMAFFPRTVDYFRRNDWAGRTHMPGGEAVFDSPVNNATAHYLHNMFYLLGRTRETSAMPATVQAELYRANDIQNYDTAAVRSVTECGTELLFYTTHAAPTRQGPRCRYEFEDAVVEYDAGHVAGGEFIARFRDGRIRNYGQPNLDPGEKIWQSVDAARTGDAVACGIPAAMGHARCVAAAQHSSPEITSFPRAMKQTLRSDGLDMICIDGLDQALRECFERAILPAEHPGAWWARAGSPVQAIAPHVTVARPAAPAVAAQ